MPTQKALLLVAKRGALEVHDVPIPTPGPDDVLIRIEATALNPIDWKIQAYGIVRGTFPAGLGTSAAGVVEDVGTNVKDRKKGDRVLFQGDFVNDSSTFQQYAINPAAFTSTIPESLSLEEAATLPTPLLTVFLQLWNKDPIAPPGWSARFTAPWEDGGLTAYAGKPAFIIGGASSLGQLAIQAAKLSRRTPIITTVSPHNAELVKSFGATHIIDRSLSNADVLAQLKELAGGAPIDFVYDAVGTAPTQALGHTALAPGGTLVLALPTDLPAATLAEGEKAGKKVVASRGLTSLPQNRTAGAEIFARTRALLESGDVKPNPVEVVPGGLRGIPEGLARLREDKVRGVKLVARPFENAD